MQRQRLAVVLVMVGILAACTSSNLQNPILTTTLPTPGPLTKIVHYWDLGVSVKYPDNWEAPQFSAGQLTLAPSPDAVRNRVPAQPVMAVRIVDPIRELRLSKSATLEQIAAATSAGETVKISRGGNTQVAGLDAAYVNVSEENIKLYGQTVAFRLPDGRVGVLVGISPLDMWANFAPAFDQMRGGITLLKPTDFTLPQAGGESGAFPQGGITFSIPKGWIDKDLGGNAHLYHDGSAIEYVDGSGYVNGLQLVVFALPLPQDAPLGAILLPFVRAQTGDIVTYTSVGGQPALEIVIVNPTTGQNVTLVGFASQDKRVLIVFRWTAPAILTEASRPTFDAILQSVKFSSITATLISPPTRPNPTVTP